MIQITRTRDKTVITIAYEIVGEWFVWTFEPHSKYRVRVQVALMVIKKDVHFTWQDAANVYQLINKAIGIAGK